MKLSMGEGEWSVSERGGFKRESASGIHPKAEVLLNSLFEQFEAVLEGSSANQLGVSK